MHFLSIALEEIVIAFALSFVGFSLWSVLTYSSRFLLHTEIYVKGAQVFVLPAFSISLIAILYLLSGYTSLQPFSVVVILLISGILF